MTKGTLTFPALFAVAIVLLSPTSFGQAKYVPVGIGGGGSMYAPASSPHDPKLMFVSCDMGGLYRSEDGGASWTLLDFRNIHGSTQCRPAFHPTKPNVIYFATKVSEDFGKTWKDIPNAPFKGGVTHTALSDQGRTIVVGLADGACISRDEGKTWVMCDGVKGKVVGIVAGAPAFVAIATTNAVYESRGAGKPWVDISEGLPWRDIRSLAGWTSRPNVDGFSPELFCTIPSKNENGKFAGGIYTHAGQGWQSVMGEGLNTSLGKKDEWGSGDIPQYNFIEASEGRLYVTCRGTGYWPPYQDTVYRSDDYGKAWRMVQFYDFRFMKSREPGYKGIAEMNFEHGWISYTITWMWGGFPGNEGFSVNERNPDVAMATNAGELFVTTDGGKLWRQVYTKYAPGQDPPLPDPESNKKRPGRWQSIGLEVTTTWNYRIDPTNHRNHFICYTDIGLMRSEDGGLTWTDSNAGSPWAGNTYDILFDPEKKGRAWAAMSSQHDIPHWTNVHEGPYGPGGVCVSDDGGKTWKKSCAGLPNAPITSLILDPKSPAGNRTLYCTAYGFGVFKSTDNGKSWVSASNGIDLKKNNHAVIVQMHPNGTLYASVTAMRGPGANGNTYSVPGALYRSADGGANWTDITGSNPIYWPVEFAVHPTNPDILYVAAHTPTRREDGGIYKTTDGGKSWTRLLKNEDYVGKGGPNWATSMFLTMDPKDPETLYMGTDGHGLWISHDGAKSWKQLEGMPFGSVHRVTFDPDDANLVYITTFGASVWRGPKP